MENIDTLLFSGGGLKCISILGSLRYLFENNIIKYNFKDIKDIFYISGSSIFTLPLLIGFSIDATIEIFKKINYSSIINEDSMSLDNLFTNFGLNDMVSYCFIVETILSKKNINKDITLKEFHSIININTHYKVINISLDKVEYLNHIDHPDLPLKKAIAMTCCVPLLFSPIEYNGSLYIDGGAIGNFPYEKINVYKNYLGIDIISTRISLSEQEYEECSPTKLDTIKDYLIYLYDVYGSVYYDNPSIRHIKLLICGGSGMDFKSQEKNLDELSALGYEKTEKHINLFPLKKT
tara:strand:- start:6679 stop:7557 length:879 start_codon:yes stop_codon:yes gene_type:complete